MQTAEEMHIAKIITRGLKEIRVNLDNVRAALEGLSDDLGIEDIWQDSYHDTHAVLKEEIDYDFLVALFNLDQSIKNWTGEET